MTNEYVLRVIAKALLEEGYENFSEDLERVADSLRTETAHPEARCWISIKDMLPSEHTGDRVMVATDAGYIGCEYVHNLRRMQHDGSYVTHWMPLPEGPLTPQDGA